MAPVWPPTGGGSAMGNDDDRKKFLDSGSQGLPHRPQACASWAFAPMASCGSIRPRGVTDWADGDPKANSRRIAETFRKACDIAEDAGERLAAEGEICWGGMHSWRHMLQLLEMVDRPQTLGFQADMAHTLLYVLGYNAPEDAHPAGRTSTGSDTARFDAALKQLTAALRPWTIDFHVAQNDATVHGTGSHDKTGRHCLPNDPNGKLDIVKVAGYWLRDEKGQLTKKLPAHLLGRLHVPQQDHDEARKPGTTSSAHDDCRPRRPRLARESNPRSKPDAEIANSRSNSTNFALTTVC